MARFKVYLKLLDAGGEYTTDYVDVTQDLLSIGDIQIGIDNTEFDVGMIRASSFNITLKNNEGEYSSAENPTSIFRNRIKDTMVKVTWDIRDKGLTAGFFRAGEEALGGEAELFEGLVNTANAASKIKDQTVTFVCLGFESMLNEDVVVYHDIPDIYALSELLFDNFTHADSRLKKYATAYPPISFDTLTPSFDYPPNVGDLLANYQNKMVGEVIGSWLLGANSVMYLKKDQLAPEGKPYTIYVKGRDPTPDVKFIFRGYGSALGIENIIDIPKFSDGVNRIFNFWVWAELFASDIASRLKWGTKKKEVNVPLLFESDRQEALDVNLEEFSDPKRELEIETPIWYDTLALDILDRIAIDLPAIIVPADGEAIPRYGYATYGDFVYPDITEIISFDTSVNFKILQKKVNISKQTITFKIREI